MLTDYNQRNWHVKTNSTINTNSHDVRGGREGCGTWYEHSLLLLALLYLAVLLFMLIDRSKCRVNIWINLNFTILILLFFKSHYQSKIMKCSDALSWLLLKILVSLQSIYNLFKNGAIEYSPCSFCWCQLQNEL